MNYTTNAKAEKLAMNLFLSLSLNQVLKGLVREDQTEAMNNWILEQVAASAICLFGDGIEA